MNTNTIKDCIKQQIEDATVEVNGDGAHFNAIVVSEQFEGLSPVKKQQLVYAAIDKHIKSGAIHAISLKTYTLAEWQKINSGH